MYIEHLGRSGDSSKFCTSSKVRCLSSVMSVNTLPSTECLKRNPRSLKISLVAATGRRAVVELQLWTGLFCIFRMLS